MRQSISVVFDMLFSFDFGLVYPCRSKKADAGVDCSSRIGFVKLPE